MSLHIIISPWGIQPFLQKEERRERNVKSGNIAASITGSRHPVPLNVSLSGSKEQEQECRNKQIWHENTKNN